MTSGNASADVARMLGVLAHCDRLLVDTVPRLQLRPEVAEVRRDVTLRPFAGGGRAEFGLEAILTEPGHAAYWQLQVEWTAAGWVVVTDAFVTERGVPAELQPTARWTGASVDEFAAVVQRATATLLSDVASVSLAVAETAPRAPTTFPGLSKLPGGEEALLGIARGEWVRAYVLDGLTETEATRRVDVLFAPAPGSQESGAIALTLDLIVPLARLNPEIARGLTARLEAELAVATEDAAAAVATAADRRALLQRLRQIIPGRG
jgi:hypothetical protein